MATFQGSLSVSNIWNEEPIAPEYDLLDVPVWDEGWLTETLLSGAQADTQPVDEIPETFDGTITEMYAFLHWYNRIHIQYTRLNLGNVVGDQTIPFWILNTFLVPKTLEEIIATGVEGVELIDGGTPPYDLQPFEQRDYTLEVDASGPPSINAFYEFEFTGYGTVSIRIEGIRVIGWYWEPNWETEPKEKLKWATDVQESYNGKGQFIQLRQFPKQEWEFGFDADRRAQRTIENAVYKWNGRTWAVPVFPDVDGLETELLIGALSIPVSTDTKAYEVDGLAMLISADSKYYETAEIESIDPAFLTLKRGLSRSWPPGTRVYPVVFCRLRNGQSLAKFTARYGYGTAVFESILGRPYASLAESTLYFGYPIIYQVPEWNTDPVLAFQDKLSTLENPFGSDTVERESDIARSYYSWNWQCLSRAEIDQLRKFLYSRAGQFKAVWIPTYSEDLVLTANVPAAGRTLQVEHAGLVQFLSDEAIHRRDLRIELVDGTVFYRRASEFARVDDDNESLSINTSFGIVVNVEDVAKISWMMLMHLSSDTLEIAWASPTVAGVTLPFRGYNHDV
jgi:hypothetical protein